MVTSMRLHSAAAIFEVHLEGEISYATRLALLAEIERRLQGLRVKKLLVDYSYAWPAEEDSTDVASFQAGMLSVSFARGIGIAFVNGPAEHCEAVESISRKAGFHSGRFYERARAIEWLNFSSSVARTRATKVLIQDGWNTPTFEVSA
jgi:hypothetical protein